MTARFRRTGFSRVHVSPNQLSFEELWVAPANDIEDETMLAERRRHNRDHIADLQRMALALRVHAESNTPAERDKLFMADQLMAERQETARQRRSRAVLARSRLAPLDDDRWD